MRYFASILLILCTVAVQANAATCTVPAESIKPVMNPSPELIASYISEFDTGTHQMQEEITLADGMKIVYSGGGCDHYSETYVFENIPVGLTIGREPHQLAIELLEHVPGATKHFLRNKFQQAFQEGAEVDEAGGFDCDEAYCIMRREGNRVDLEYDSAL